MIGRGPNSCLLGHVTGLLFCFYVQLFLPSIFNSVDFRSSMSCIVIDFELTDKNFIKKLGVFIEGKIQGYSFCPPKKYKGYSFCPPRKYKRTKQAFWCTKILHRIVWNGRRLYYSELSNILPRAVKGEQFAEGTEKCEILGNLMDKEVENLEDHVCPKVQDHVGEEVWIRSNYTFRHNTTLHCPERKAKLFGNWILRHLKLKFVMWNVLSLSTKTCRLNRLNLFLCDSLLRNCVCKTDDWSRR